MYTLCLCTTLYTVQMDRARDKEKWINKHTYERYVSFVVQSRRFEWIIGIYFKYLELFFLALWLGKKDFWECQDLRKHKF